VGKECTFAIAGIELRKTLADQLTDGVKVLEDNSDVQRFLQSIDNDGDPSNGIQITPEVLTVLTQALQTFNSTGKLPKDTVLEDVVGHIDHNAPTFNGEIKSPEQVATHFQGTLDGITNNVTNTDAQLKALFAGKSYYSADAVSYNYGTPIIYHTIKFSWDANLKATFTQGEWNDDGSVDATHTGSITYQCSIANAAMTCNLLDKSQMPESDMPQTIIMKNAILTQDKLFVSVPEGSEHKNETLFTTEASARAWAMANPDMHCKGGNCPDTNNTYTEPAPAPAPAPTTPDEPTVSTDPIDLAGMTIYRIIEDGGYIESSTFNSTMTAMTWKNEYKCTNGTTDNVMGNSGVSNISVDGNSIIMGAAYPPTYIVSMSDTQIIFESGTGETMGAFLNLEEAKTECDSL